LFFRGYYSGLIIFPFDTEQGEIQVRGEVYSSDGILLSQNYENLKIVETFARDFAH
jgi:hypothetical protein